MMPEVACCVDVRSTLASCRPDCGNSCFVLPGTMCLMASLVSLVFAMHDCELVWLVRFLLCRHLWRVSSWTTTDDHDLQQEMRTPSR